MTGSSGDLEDGAGDLIRITGVRAMGTHGVLCEEHTNPQPFVVDVTMRVDTERAVASDDLADTVSYAEVAADVVAIVEGAHVDLIESIAARVAGATLARELVEEVSVTVHKPDAPVGVPYGDVAVTVRRRDVRHAVVALGANQGDSLATLHRAVAELGALPRTRVRALSRLARTDPVGGPDQPEYLNAVAIVETTLRPRTLLRRLHEIEARHGRTRDVRWGARTLDLDLVQYGDPRDGTDVVTGDADLTLPHPRAHVRGFVLVPWVQADPAAQLRLGSEVVAVGDLVGGLSGDAGDGTVAGVRPGPDWEGMGW